MLQRLPIPSRTKRKKNEVLRFISQFNVSIQREKRNKRKKKKKRNFFFVDENFSLRQQWTMLEVSERLFILKVLYISYCSLWRFLDKSSKRNYWGEHKEETGVDEVTHE